MSAPRVGGGPTGSCSSVLRLEPPAGERVPVAGAPVTVLPRPGDVTSAPHSATAAAAVSSATAPAAAGASTATAPTASTAYWSLADVERTTRPLWADGPEGRCDTGSRGGSVSPIGSGTSGIARSTSGVVSE